MGWILDGAPVGLLWKFSQEGSNDSAAEARVGPQACRMDGDLGRDLGSEACEIQVNPIRPGRSSGSGKAEKDQQPLKLA